MRKSFLLISASLVLGFGNTRAGEGGTKVPSALRSVMVYRNGAEMVHTASARLEQGTNQLIIGDVSNRIDESSVRISCNSNVTILSITVATDYLTQEPAGPFIKKLQDSI